MGTNVMKKIIKFRQLRKKKAAAETAAKIPQNVTVHHRGIGQSPYYRDRSPLSRPAPPAGPAGARAGGLRAGGPQQHQLARGAGMYPSFTEHRMAAAQEENNNSQYYYERDEDDELDNDYANTSRYNMASTARPLRDARGRFQPQTFAANEEY